jgi:hypothetical protein
MNKQFLNFLGSTIIVGIFLFLAFGSDDSKSNDTTDEPILTVETIEGTKSCLVGYDWVYPNSSNPTGAWKFSSDGTFNSSTTMFGGMSTWGNWEAISPGKIKITYTRTSEGIIPDGQTLTLSSCSSLKVGSTIYSKD